MLDFGDKLRRFRKSAGKTQGEFGQMVGAPQSTNLEMGKRPQAIGRARGEPAEADRDTD